MKYLMILLIVSLFVSGCSGSRGFFGRSGHGSNGGVKYSELRPNELAQEVPVQVKRSNLIEVLKNQNLNRARLVEVFPREGAPSYRLFDVQPGSAYIMLGLSSSDTILAADDFVISEGRQFLQFISALPNERQATIRIRRAGQTGLLNIQIID